MGQEVPPYNRISQENIANAPHIMCITPDDNGEPCNGEVFVQGFMIKQISAIISPTGKTEHVPVQVFVCNKCGRIPTFESGKGIGKGKPSVQ